MPSARRPSPPSTSPAALPATVGTTSWWPPGVRAGAAGTGSSGGRLPKDVTHAAHRVDQSRLTIGLGFSAEVPHVDLQRVARGGKVESPYLLEDAAAGEHPARIGDQHLQQRELGAGQADPAF